MYMDLVESSGASGDDALKVMGVVCIGEVEALVCSVLPFSCASGRLFRVAFGFLSPGSSWGPAICRALGWVVGASFGVLTPAVVPAFGFGAVGCKDSKLSGFNGARHQCCPG